MTQQGDRPLTRLENIYLLNGSLQPYLQLRMHSALNPEWPPAPRHAGAFLFPPSLF